MYHENTKQQEGHDEDTETNPDNKNVFDIVEISYKQHNQETIADQEHGPLGFSTTGLFLNCAEHLLVYI